MSEKQKHIKGSPVLGKYEYKGHTRLRDASWSHAKLRGLHDEPVSETIFDVNFWNKSIAEAVKDVHELLTGKRLKAAEAKLREEEKLFAAAKRMYELTGHQPGEKSGILKNEKIANNKSAAVKQAVKIRTAMVLVYGKDPKQKKAVMTEIKSKYPELVDEIQSLVKRAKAESLKKATVGLKTGAKQSVNTAVYKGQKITMR